MVEEASFVRRDEKANPKSDKEAKVGRFLQWTKDSGNYNPFLEFVSN
jgi:hypothetical protein